MASDNFVDKEFEEDYDSGEEVNDRQHEKLLRAIHVMDNQERIKPPSRMEPTLEISEFHLPKIKPIDLNDLAASLTTQGKRFDSKIAAKVQDLSKRIKVLPKPLEKVEAEKIRRVIAYKNLAKHVGRWDALVQTNRAARSISFPLDNGTVQMGSTELASKWKSQTPSELEEGINKILGLSKTAEKDKNDNEMYLLTLAELREKRGEMAKFRAQLSYEAARAKRIKNIKSKSYRRVLRKEKMRKSLKDFETLRKTDPEAALMQLEKMEKARAEERASLRHKNSGKWARSRLIRAKYDPQTRLELAEQLAKSRDITKKLKTNDSSDEDDQRDDENCIKIFSEDGNNPWITTVKPQSEIQEFISGYRKYWEKRNESEPKPKESEVPPTIEKSCSHELSTKPTPECQDVEEIEDDEYDANDKLNCFSQNEPSDLDCNKREETIVSPKCLTKSQNVKKTPKSKVLCSQKNENGNGKLKSKVKCLSQNELCDLGSNEEEKITDSPKCLTKSQNVKKTPKSKVLCSQKNENGNEKLKSKVKCLPQNEISDLGSNEEEKIIDSPKYLTKSQNVKKTPKSKVLSSQKNGNKKLKSKVKCLSQIEPSDLGSNEEEKITDSPKCLTKSQNVKKTPKSKVLCSQKNENRKENLKNKLKCLSQNKPSDLCSNLEDKSLDSSKSSQNTKEAPELNEECVEENKGSNMKLKRKRRKGNSEESEKSNRQILRKSKDLECEALNKSDEINDPSMMRLDHPLNFDNNSISVSKNKCISKSPQKKKRVGSVSGTWDVAEVPCTKPLKDNSINLTSPEISKPSPKPHGSDSHVELFLNSVNEMSSVVKSTIKKKRKKTSIDVMFEKAEYDRSAKVQEKLAKLEAKLNLKKHSKSLIQREGNEEEVSDLGASLALKSMKERRPIEDKELVEGTKNDENENLQKLLHLASSSANGIDSSQGVGHGTESLGGTTKNDTTKNLVNATLSLGNSSGHCPKPNETNINPNNFIAAKPKVLLSAVPDIIDAGEDALDDNDNDGEQQHAIITEAFADDDVVDKFRKEKEEEIKKSQPQDIDLFLPGWGSWAGVGIAPQKTKSKRIFFKAPPAPPRKDENKSDVIINEDVAQAIRQHQINELPRPFTSVADYEATIRAPIGNTFIPQTAHQKLIMPTVITKIGKIIEPLNDKYLVNKKVLMIE